MKLFTATNCLQLFCFMFSFGTLFPFSRLISLLNALENSSLSSFISLISGYICSSILKYSLL